MSIKSELAKTASYLRSARKAILGRGGEISLTAGLKDLAEAIYKIPADASLAYYTDDSVAYQKSVPSGTEEFAQVAKVGGMTYKCNNLIPFPYYFQLTQGNPYTRNGITYTVNADGSIKVKGQTGSSTSLFEMWRDGKSEPLNLRRNVYVTASGGTSEVAVILRKKATDGTESNINGTANPKTGYLAESDTIMYISLYVSANKTVDTTIYPMINYGSTALPYETYFEGLRDTKVSELVSEGANLIPFPYESGSQTRNGITFTVNLDGGVSIKGTADSNISFVLTSNIVPSSGSITVSGSKPNAIVNVRKLTVDGRNVSLIDSVNGEPSTGTLDEGEVICLVGIYILQGSIVDATVYPMLNCGTTALPYAPYFKNTLPISSDIQAIEGYGCGVNANYHNYIDYERKVFMQKTKRIVFNGTENWELQSINSVGLANFMCPLTQKAEPMQIICSHCYTDDSLIADATKEGIMTNPNLVFVRSFAYQTVDEWKAHLAELYANGNLFVAEYALAEPIETDISTYLDNDSFIEVESSGSINAVNEYEYDAPSTINYITKVGM